MSSIVISGDTSGSVTLDAPAIAGSTVLTLPTTTGTLALTSETIGSGQTWQLPTRVSGTSYTNSTGKPIQVAISFSQGLSGSGSATVVVGGVTISSTSYSTSAGGGGLCYTFSFIVPNSTAYTVTVTGNTGISTWAELR